MHLAHATWALALAFALIPGARAETVNQPSLTSRANSAYAARQFRESAQLFDQAIASDEASAGNYYNAACSYALAGAKDLAFARLASAIDAGYLDAAHLRRDSDLEALHDDPRWGALLERIDAAVAADPLSRLLARAQDRTLPLAARYFATDGALRAGELPPERVQRSLLPALHAFLSTFVGDYPGADAIYPVGAPRLDPRASGHSRALPLLDAILPLTRARQAVFLNEAHGNASTRLATYLLLKPLREQGFTHLALEALWVKKSDGEGCGNAEIHDADLAQRGYPIAGEMSGYYLNDPVFAELVREALRLGYSLYAYESMADGPSDIPTREQGQADNLACLFAQQPEARVLLLGGFAHIGKHPDLAGGRGQGWMAYRFMRKTGIEPLSIDTTTLRHRHLEDLRYPIGRQQTVSDVYALADAAGALLGDPSSGFDITLYIPAPGDRSAAPNWLELGGDRIAVEVGEKGCRNHRPCLIEAFYASENNDAVPADRCVLKAAEAKGCRLYLRSGEYRLRHLNDELRLLQESVLTAAHATTKSP